MRDEMETSFTAPIGWTLDKLVHSAHRTLRISFMPESYVMLASFKVNNSADGWRTMNVTWQNVNQQD